MFIKSFLVFLFSWSFPAQATCIIDTDGDSPVLICDNLNVTQTILSDDETKMIVEFEDGFKITMDKDSQAIGKYSGEVPWPVNPCKNKSNSCKK